MHFYDLKSKWWAKLIAAVLLFIFGIGLIGSAAGIYLCDSYGVYQYSRENLQENLNRQILDKYAVLALSNYTGNSNREMSPNYRYAVYEGSGTGGTQICGNLDEDPGKIAGDAVYHEFTVTDSTTYRLADSVFDTAYVNEDASRGLVTEYIGEFYYSEIDESETSDTEKATEKKESSDIKSTTDNKKSSEKKTEFYVSGRDSSSEVLYRIKPSLYRADIKNGMLWIAKSNSGEVGLPLSEIKKVEMGKTSLSFSPYVVNELLIDEGLGYSIHDGLFAAGLDEATTTFTIVGTTAEPLTYTGSWKTADLFEQADIMLGWFYRIRYLSIITLIGCLILGLSMFVFLMRAAGHRNNDKVSLLPIDRIPMDLAAGITFTLCAICAIPAAKMVQDISTKPLMSLPMFILLLAVSYVIALAFFMSLAVNIKVGGWWKRTVLCRCFMLIIRFFGWLRNGFKHIYGEYRKFAWNVSMRLRILVGFACFAVFCLFGMMRFRTGNTSMILFWLIMTSVSFLLVLKFLVDFGKIKGAGSELAHGNMNYKIDTDRMLTDFAELGISLNTIGDGLTAAVEDRMKSERMKTELITNVSHDIKTPLTSIINYTDLLTRLDLEDPAAREYLEVLERQSARLKKLIEDLIEASKASSGVLKLEMNTVDVSMLLMQAVGEYEDKFSNKGLDLRVNTEKAGIMVQADSRYLWRVFDNLLSNMLKYAQSGTRAYIDLISDEGTVKVIFRNISEAPLHISGDELMERFVRGDSSRSTEGSGLGLSIADSLIKLMGGNMEIIVDGDLFKVEIAMDPVNG